MNNIIDKYKDISLSDRDVLGIVQGKANLVIYHDLHKYSNVDEILEPFGACFILFESKPRYGHWCLLFKVNENMVEFFNPYGGFPDDSLDSISKSFKRQSNQDKPYLSRLLLNSRYILSYNEYDFQKRENNIKTCGRWCSVRLVCRNLTLNQFAKLFKNNNGDDMVTLLTMWINKI